MSSFLLGVPSFPTKECLNELAPAPRGGLRYPSYATDNIIACTSCSTASHCHIHRNEGEACLTCSTVLASTMRPALSSRNACTHREECSVLLSALNCAPLVSPRHRRSIRQPTLGNRRKRKEPTLSRIGPGKCNASSSISLQESTDANIPKEKSLPGGVKEGMPHSAGCLLLS